LIALAASNKNIEIPNYNFQTVAPPSFTKTLGKMKQKVADKILKIQQSGII
jgi:hypothetical protein